MRFLRRLLGRRSHRDARARGRGRGGFAGPFPYDSGRARGGTRYTVSGCCLPVFAAMAAGAGLGLRELLRR